MRVEPSVPVAWTSLPRLPLLAGPTPLTDAPRFCSALRLIAARAGHGGPASLRMKREDLAPVGLGGNKLRNLELLLGDALATGADAVVTAGRRWSNHARLTAAAAAVAGLEAHLVLTGPQPRTLGPSAALAVGYGARIHWTSGPERAERDGLVARVTQELRSGGRTPAVVGVGGTGRLGAVAQALGAVEMAAQARDGGAAPDVVVLASATGGTQAGLLVGLALAGVSARVVGAAVAHEPEELAATIADLASTLARESGVSAGRPELLDARGPGYGRRSHQADEAAALLATSEGIDADAIYTAKALAALLDVARRGDLDGAHVVFWHGGGTPGLFEPLDAEG